MAGKVVVAEVAGNLQKPRRRAVGGEIAHQVQIRRIHAEDQPVAPERVVKQPHHGTAVAGALLERRLDAAENRQGRRLLAEDVLDGGWSARARATRCLATCHFLQTTIISSRSRPRLASLSQQPGRERRPSRPQLVRKR